MNICSLYLAIYSSHNTLRSNPLIEYIEETEKAPYHVYGVSRMPYTSAHCPRPVIVLILH